MEKIRKTEEEWRRALSPEKYRILREKATEPPFTGEYYHVTRPGVYRCAACGQPLFDAATKYESGSGWPSFYQPIVQQSVATNDDHSHFMSRTEVLCSRCDSHLGHVFPDGPEPTGLRYCINSAALQLDPETGDAGDR